jgi:ligand-binding sensor domain-containing protein
VKGGEPVPERDYSHRDVVDKLGVKPGHAVAFVEAAGPVDWELRERVLARAGRDAAAEGEPANVVLASIDAGTDAVALLREWRGRIAVDGGIWLLSPKRGLPGYVNQSELIAAGLEAGLVDNKSCSVSETTSGLRFVIRRADRPQK